MLFQGTAEIFLSELQLPHTALFFSRLLGRCRPVNDLLPAMMQIYFPDCLINIFSKRAIVIRVERDCCIWNWFCIKSLNRLGVPLFKSKKCLCSGFGWQNLPGNCCYVKLAFVPE